jgi:hypothetical protein
MKKRGQMQISFSFIISIIIIIAIIATAFYVVKNFLNVSKCAEIGLFLEDIEGEVRKAYTSSIYQDVYSGRLPGNIEYVCFGNLTQKFESSFRKERESLREDLFRDEWGHKLFLLPVEESCSGDLNSKSLNEISTENFFCVPVEKGSMEVKMEKSSGENSVKVSYNV